MSQGFLSFLGQFNVNQIMLLPITSGRDLGIMSVLINNYFNKYFSTISTCFVDFI